MARKRKILFLGETGRADAQTWMKGMREYGDFEIETWELPAHTGRFKRVKRILDWCKACVRLRKLANRPDIDMVAAYRITSYGFLAAFSGKRPMVVAQQGRNIVFPVSGVASVFKARLADYAIRNADLIHAWGDVMVPALKRFNADMNKVIVRAKGVDKNLFYYDPAQKEQGQILGIVTRSLAPDYRHEVILKAIRIVKDRGYKIRVIMIGDGPLREKLENLTRTLKIEDCVDWKGRIPNSDLPVYLRQSNIYISTPISEGVSSSLFEAMACGTFPVVTDVPGTAAWINHGENGYLVPVDDYQQLAEHIILAFEKSEMREKGITHNLSIVREKATYQENMPMFFKRYHELIDAAQRN